MSVIIIFRPTEHDDGCQIHDWFEHGEQTIEAAENATTPEEAEAILRADYKGPAIHGVEVRWEIYQ
jgi:hypothetical protein